MSPSRRRRYPCNREKEEIVKNTDTVKAQGLGAVLGGCANCCEGVLQQVRDANASQDIIQRLEQARDICRSLADDLPQ
jgi:hypothetical protein